MKASMMSMSWDIILHVGALSACSKTHEILLPAQNSFEDRHFQARLQSVEDTLAQFRQPAGSHGQSQMRSPPQDWLRPSSPGFREDWSNEGFDALAIMLPDFAYS
jgi:hypothetical protein